MARSKPTRQSTYEEISQKMMTAIFIMLLIIVTLVGLHTLSGRPLIAQTPLGPIVAEREITLWGDTRGAARVSDAEGMTLMEFDVGQGGFVSTIDRVIRRERLVHGVAETGPLMVRLREGEQVTVYDPSTGNETPMINFGHSNAAHFRALLIE